jgi:hypothetical protein
LHKNGDKFLAGPSLGYLALRLLAITTVVDLQWQAVAQPVSLATAPKVAFVRNAKDFQAAMASGTEHIIIKEHMDLSSLPAKKTAHGRVAFVVPSALKSITVYIYYNMKLSTAHFPLLQLSTNGIIKQAKCFVCFLLFYLQFMLRRFSRRVRKQLELN